MSNKIENEMSLSAFVTNLGKYNEGELVGEWVEFPVSQKELDDVFKRIGIGEKDEFGQPYEEYFITDYDGNTPSELRNQLGEYTNIETLQVIAKILEKINELGDEAVEVFEGLLENFDYLDAAANVIEGNYEFLSGVENNSDLGYYVVDNYFGGIKNLSEDTIETYFDYDSFGRDLRIEYCPEEDMPEDIEEWLGLSEYATDTEIGVAYVEMVGGIGCISNPERYFDYEAYGRDIDIEGQYVYTSNGAVDYRDCSDGIGQELYDEIKDEMADDRDYQEEER